MRLDRTSAFIGMACDAEITRTVLRAALPDLLSSSVIGATELARREIAMDAGFDAARVVGCMPNIPANRLNRQFGFGGPSFTIAAEELSGVRALEIAVDALASNEIDAALVGAVDLSVEPVHRSVSGELPSDSRTPGDGACVLILKRVEDAIRDNDSIRAIIDLSDDRDPVLDNVMGRRVKECFGHVHAASGLLEIVATSVVLDRRVEFDAAGGLVPFIPEAEPRRIQLRLEALGSQASTVCVVESERPAVVQPSRTPLIPSADIYIYSAHDLAGLSRNLELDRACGYDKAGLPECRLALVATARSARNESGRPACSSNASSPAKSPEPRHLKVFSSVPREPKEILHLFLREPPLPIQTWDASLFSHYRNLLQETARPTGFIVIRRVSPQPTSSGCADPRSFARLMQSSRRVCLAWSRTRPSDFLPARRMLCMPSGRGRTCMSFFGTLRDADFTRPF